MNLITWFHEQRDSKYWTNIIYLKLEHKVISISIITRFHDPRDYRYWINKINFEFKYIVISMLICN